MIILIFVGLFSYIKRVYRNLSRFVTFSSKKSLDGLCLEVRKPLSMRAKKESWDTFPARAEIAGE